MYCHCGTNNRAPRWTSPDPCKPEVRPGAWEESASPAWLAAPAINARNTTKVYIWRLDTACGPTLYRKCHSHNTPRKRYSNTWVEPVAGNCTTSSSFWVTKIRNFKKWGKNGYKVDFPRGKNGYKKGEKWLYSQISPGGKLLYSHFSGGKNCYIAIFPGGKMARGKDYYITPVVLRDEIIFVQKPHFLAQKCKMTIIMYSDNVFFYRVKFHKNWYKTTFFLDIPKRKVSKISKVVTFA